MNLLIRLAVFPFLMLVPFLLHGQAKQDSVRNVRQLRIVKPKFIPIKRELSAGLRLNSNGWGIYADYGSIRADDERKSDLFYQVRLLDLSFNEVKAPKERRQNATLPGVGDYNPRPYIFGKINNFYSLKIGYGNRRMLAGKPEVKTVSLHLVYSGGLAVGFLKPYYINVYMPSGSGIMPSAIRYSEGTKAYFLDPNYIIGKAGFTQGLGEMIIIPGIHAKVGLHFDFAAKRTRKMALETGVAAELYTQKIPVMAGQTAHSFLFNAYLGIQFGKRW
jgi:hypothetical protein